jgi:hypothetical protein
MSELTNALADFVALFDRFGAPYAVMGGLAVRVYAIPRPTYDVDFTVLIDRDRLPEFYAAAESLGYKVPEPYKKARCQIATVRRRARSRRGFFFGRIGISKGGYPSPTNAHDRRVGRFVRKPRGFGAVKTHRKPAARPRRRRGHPFHTGGA